MLPFRWVLRARRGGPVGCQAVARSDVRVVGGLTPSVGSSGLVSRAVRNELADRLALRKGWEARPFRSEVQDRAFEDGIEADLKSKLLKRPEFGVATGINVESATSCVRFLDTG